jgi:hypothetical protein
MNCVLRRFRQPEGLLPLPADDGSIDLLRPYVNLTEPDRIAPQRRLNGLAINFRTATKRTDRHFECRRRRQEPALDRLPTIMSRHGGIGGMDQGRRPAVNPNERTSSVENPTFDALCGLVRRPAVTLCCHSIYVIRWSYAEYSGAQP